MGHHKITTKWYTNKVERMEISLPCWNGISAGSDWQRTMSEGFLTTEMLRRGCRQTRWEQHRVLGEKQLSITRP